MSDLPKLNLRKGQIINLRKRDAGLKHAIVGLGWDVKKATTGADFDLDVCCFMLVKSGENYSLLNEQYFIFYNNKSSPDNAIEHTGDDRTGGNSETGDDEQIKVEFAKIDPKVVKLVFTITIHEARARKQNFGQVMNAYVRVVNAENDNELLKFDLSEEHSMNTSMIACEIDKNRDGEWEFNPLGDGYTYELDSFVNKFYTGGCQY